MIRASRLTESERICAGMLFRGYAPGLGVFVFLSEPLTKPAPAPAIGQTSCETPVRMGGLSRFGSPFVASVNWNCKVRVYVSN